MLIKINEAYVMWGASLARAGQPHSSFAQTLPLRGFLLLSSQLKEKAQMSILSPLNLMNIFNTIFYHTETRKFPAEACFRLPIGEMDN